MEHPTLRALTVGEILDRAFRIYRTRFIPFMGVVALMLIPESILRFIIVLVWEDNQAVNNILTGIFQNLAMLALIVAISQANLGRECTINAAYGLGSKKFWSVIGSNLLVGLAIGIPAIVVGLCMALVVPLGVLGILLYLPVVVFLSTRWSLNSSVIVLENVGAIEGLYRSWELTKDHFWRVLGTSFAASLFSLLLTILPYYFVNFLLLDMLGFSTKVVELLGLVVEQVSVALVLPFTVAVKVLIYYDLRIRKEGFDLALRAEEQPDPVSQS